MALRNETCLITGATGGIGAELARLLARHGAKLIVTGRRSDALQALLDTLPGQDGQHIAIVADQADASDVQSLAATAIDHNVSLLVNLSGINDFAWFDQQSPELIDRIIELNLRAPMQLTRALLPALQKQPRATIVNIGSTFGSIGHPGYTAYCASKFALRGFSEALARELHDSSVDVLYIAPRSTETNMNGAAATALNEALGNSLDSPEWVAEQIVDSIERSRRRRLLGWPEKLSAMLNQLVPGIVDLALARQLPRIREIAQTTRPGGASAEGTNDNPSHAR